MATIDLSTLNAGQRAVVERLDEPLFVSAGAGSGKTFTLTARLAHALSEGSAPDGGRYLDSIEQALVITFTDAAALEIKERVRAALREAGESDPLLREESLKVDGAWISTIHGMCSRILHRHAIELGIDPRFEVCEGSVAEALHAQALEEVMTRVQEDDAYAALREELPLWDGPNAVVSLMAQLRSEANKCMDGFDAFVFPQSSEAEGAVMRTLAAFEAIGALKMTERQRAVADASLSKLRAFAELAPGQRTPQAACEALEGVKAPALSKADQKPLKQDAEAALAEAVVLAHYERVQGLAPQLVELAREVDGRYAELKRARSLLDNDDLISCALAAVEGNPEVARDYAGRFKLVMIDEFQDTDQRQLRLISLLSGPGARHLTTVGDAQQSIYRFRGGDVAVFRARGASLEASQHVEMDVNYRSDPAVLALVERVCGDGGCLSDFLKLACDAHRRSSYTARDDAGEEPTRIRLEVAQGGNADLMSAAQAAMIADRLAAYHAQGQRMGDMALLLGVTSKVGLYLDALRARGLQAVVTGGSSFSSAPEVGVVQALLHTLSNPHDTEPGLFRLLSSEAFLLDADDFCQLGTRTQDTLDAPTKRPIERCFMDGKLELYGSGEPSARLRLAHEVLVRAFARLGRWELADVCQAVVEESGWLARLEREGIDGLSRAANVLAAVRYVRELTQGLGLGAARAAEEFDRWLAATKLTPANLVGEALDAVQVMTIHGSKGLQFPITAVAECWKNPSSGGRLVAGQVGDNCVLCVTPGSPVRDFSKYRKAYDVPLDSQDCRSVADWALYLGQQEQAADAAEGARLLYVALTRAEEALVVGVPVSDQDQYLSERAMGVLGAFPELDVLHPGECMLEVNPMRLVEAERRVDDGNGGRRTERSAVTVEPGMARVVSLLRPKRGSGDPWQAEAAGTMPGFEGVLPEAAGEVAVLGAPEAVAPPSQEDEAYLIPVARPTPLPQAHGWKARAGVFSYSSAHAQMEAARPEVGGPAPQTTPGAEAVTPEPPRAGRPPTPSKAEQQAAAEGAPYAPDVDKATNLGSAFHELAQTMVETQRAHDPKRLEALARTWHLSERQHRRLREAITRWEGSALRQEVWTHDLVRAEVPFFVRVDARYGNYVEGAIDLLACDHGSTSALVVDYKTGDVGLTRAQVEERHRMQANFYAWVMMSQGYAEVTCAFCCVEVDDGTGGPLVVRYRFDAETPPRIE